METKIKVTRDWERDGLLVYENARTIELYKSLADELARMPKGYEDELFCAFTEEQFQDGLAKLPEDAKGLKIWKTPSGVFGTARAIDALYDRDNEIYRRIKTECDPQEVYYFEFNNYESFVSWSGDKLAICKVMSYFGEEVARTIKRDRAFYTIDEIKNRAYNIKA